MLARVKPAHGIQQAQHAGADQIVYFHVGRQVSAHLKRYLPHERQQLNCLCITIGVGKLRRSTTRCGRAP